MISVVPPRNEEIIVTKEGKPEKGLNRFFLALKMLADLILNEGFSGTITTAKLTGGGVNGSMTFQNGILISQVAAT